MGLDIYFEKRKRDFDFTPITKMRKERDELEKQLDNEIGEKYENEVWSLIRRVENGESLMNMSDAELDRIPEEAIDIARKVVPLYGKYRKLCEEIEAANPRTEVAYFRKVNLLMVFFDYEGNCEYKVISQGEIEDLIDRCNRVLADHELAETLLPTTSGFFFGSTDYDEWYFHDVKEVRDTFQKILDETNFGNEVVEMYAWY